MPTARTGARCRLTESVACRGRPTVASSGLRWGSTSTRSASPVPATTDDADRVDVEPHRKPDEATVGRPRQATDGRFIGFAMGLDIYTISVVGGRRYRRVVRNGL